MCITIDLCHITVCIIQLVYGLRYDFFTSTGKRAEKQESQKSVHPVNERLMVTTFVFV